MSQSPVDQIRDLVLVTERRYYHMGRAAAYKHAERRLSHILSGGRNLPTSELLARLENLREDLRAFTADEAGAAGVNP